jgi:hypothetical protein
LEDGEGDLKRFEKKGSPSQTPSSMAQSPDGSPGCTPPENEEIHLTDLQSKDLSFHGNLPSEQMVRIFRKKERSISIDELSEEIAKVMLLEPE